MSTENTNVFRKENLDGYLKELAKEYKKAGGKNMPAELILVGGAAVIESYGFRDMTTDIDAVIHAASAMQDAIRRVGDRFSLPNGWLNADFQKTASYSPQLNAYAIFYKSFYQVLDVRIVTGEYLIAMKLRAFRAYKNDLSDIIGILAAHEKRGDRITLERMDAAVKALYGAWEGFPAGAKDFITQTLAAESYAKIYDLVRQNERDARETLIDFAAAYPKVLSGENAADILACLRAKKQREKP